MRALNRLHSGCSVYYTTEMGSLVDFEIPDALNHALCQINWYPPIRLHSFFFARLSFSFPPLCFPFLKNVMLVGFVC